MVFIGVLLYLGIVFFLLSWNVYGALGFIFVSSILVKQFLPQIKGYIGEYNVRKILTSLKGEYSTLHNVYVAKQNGEMTQIDHIVLSPYGIFVIETKNYTGWIFGSEEQKNWTQTIYKKKSRFYNPVMQNQTHIKAIQQYLNLKSDVPIHSIIVFSNAATLKFKEPFQQAKVIQNKDLKRTIQQFKTERISKEQVQHMAQKLDVLVNRPKQAQADIRKQHLEHVKEITASSKLKTVPVNTNGSQKCLKCGGKLILRNGKRGAFYGCESFPKCRFTCDVKKES